MSPFGCCLQAKARIYSGINIRIGIKKQFSVIFFFLFYSRRTLFAYIIKTEKLNFSSLLSAIFCIFSESFKIIMDFFVFLLPICFSNRNKFENTYHFCEIFNKWIKKKKKKPMSIIFFFQINLINLFYLKAYNRNTPVDISFKSFKTDISLLMTSC